MNEYFRIKNQTYQPTDFSGGYEKVSNSEAIVHYMHELQNSGVHATASDTVTYDTCIGAYTISSNMFNTDAPLKAEKVFRGMIHLRNNGNLLVAPDHRSYDHLVSAWHRWVLPVLCYPSNLVIYHYPPFWVILMVILLNFIIQYYPKFLLKILP